MLQPVSVETLLELGRL